MQGRDSLCRRGAEVQTQLADLQDLKAEYEALQINDRIEVCRHCQLEKVYKRELRRLVLCMNHSKAGAVEETLISLGAKKNTAEPLRATWRETFGSGWRLWKPNRALSKGVEDRREQCTMGGYSA